MMPLQSMPCPNCGRNAVLITTGEALVQTPPNFVQLWRCRCGFAQPTGVLSGLRQRQSFEQIWDLANTPAEPAEKE